jgi:hypothetical protein
MLTGEQSFLELAAVLTAWFTKWRDAIGLRTMKVPEELAVMRELPPKRVFECDEVVCRLANW